MSDSNYPSPAVPTDVAPVVGPTGEDPGRVMGIVGLILAIVANWIGLIVSIVAFRKSKSAGFQNAIAKAGIIVGCITTALAVAGAVALFTVGGSLISKCSDLGPGVHEVNGVTYTCG
jgi:hypothetical protein